MRRATEMMVLAKDHPYPKDLGIDLLVIKEKRRRREPPLAYDISHPARSVPDGITYDPKGNFRIGIEGNRIIAVIHGKAIKGSRWQDVLFTILSQEMSLFSTMLAILGGNCTRQNSRSAMAELRAGRRILVCRYLTLSPVTIHIYCMAAQARASHILVKTEDQAKQINEAPYRRRIVCRGEFARRFHPAPRQERWRPSGGSARE